MTGKQTAELKQTQDLLQVLCDSSPDWVFVKDLDHKFLLVNRAFAGAQNLKPEEMIGRSDTEFWSEDLCLGNPEKGFRGFHEDDKEAFRGRTIHNPNDIATLADGSMRVFDTFKRPLKDIDGNIYGVLCYARDITDRIQSEEALRTLNLELEERIRQRTTELSRTNNELSLEIAERKKAEDNARESEQRWQSLIANIEEQHFLYIHNTDGIFTYISPSVTRILGYSPAEFCTHYTRYLTDNPVNNKAVSHTDLSIKGIKQSPYEVEIFHKDGSVKWLEVSEVPITTPQGDAIAVQGIAHDVTDRKKTENNLRKYERIAAASRDHMSFVGRDYIYQAVNDAYLRVHNKKREEIVGHSVPDLLGQEIFERLVKKNLDRCLAGEEIHYEAWFDMVGCGKRFMDVAYYPYFDEHGAVSGAVVSSRDLTDRKQAEEERRRLEEQMRHTQKLESLGVMAGGIAHDFNNILMIILGHAELATANLTADSAAQEDIKSIINAAVRAADLSKQMLAYAGKGRFVIRTLNLGEVIREISSMISVSVSKKVLLNFNLAPDLPLVEADVNQLHQVIMNLVLNASDAIGDASGTITIATGSRYCDRGFLARTWLYEDQPEGDYVYLEVSDTGCGMDKATLSKIFDPFFTTKFTGRGLGLAAVLGIIRSHRGALIISSTPGSGTTFTVFLPVASRPVEAIREEETNLKEFVSTGTVLLVDDEERVREITGKMLEKLGLKVLLASNGREALEVFMANQKDITCVLLDLTMPEMDGEETFHHMRKIRDDVRVILSSGYTSEDVLQRFLNQGLAGFIEKPYTMESLRSNIIRVLTEGI